MRSATAPDMRVVAVPMKPSWNTKKAVRNALLLSNRNDDPPMRGLSPAPNIRPKPNSQKSDAATRKLAKVLRATLIEFFDRTSPLSSAVKPACISSTSTAQRSSHARAAGLTADIVGPGSSVAAGPATLAPLERVPPAEHHADRGRTQPSCSSRRSARAYRARHRRSDEAADPRSTVGRTRL